MKRRSVYVIGGFAGLLMGATLMWKVRPVAAQPTSLVLATVFGPVTMLPTESIRSCSNNLFGATPVTLRVTVMHAISGAMIGAPQELRVPAGGGACATNPSNDKVPLPVIVVLSVPANSVSWGNDRRILANSVQLLNPEGRSTLFLPAIQVNTAVEFPAR